MFASEMITRENKDKIETLPGKFEGERLIVQLAYEAYLMGWVREDDGYVVTVDVEVDGDVETISFIQDGSGFIFEISQETLKRARA